MWAAALVAAGLGLMVLPLVPALNEWRRKRDAAPLRVVREQDTNIRHFAESFARLTIETLATYGVDCGQGGASLDGRTARGEPFAFVGEGDTLNITATERRGREVDRLVFSCGRLDLPGEMLYHRGISGRDLVLGPRSICHSVLAKGDLHLAEECVVARWAHAMGTLHAAPGCQLYSRASSDTALALARGVRFERLNAPVIRCGEGPAGTASPSFARRRTPWTPPPGAVELDHGTVLLEEGLEVPEAARVAVNLVIHGDLEIGAASLVTGSLKARGRLVLGAGSVVRGAVVSQRGVLIRAGCVVTGPVIAERDVVIETGAVVGASDLRTTVTAPRIQISEGTRLSGSVWAREGAEIIPARPPRL